jgi:hypothetical protein
MHSPRGTRLIDIDGDHRDIRPRRADLRGDVLVNLEIENSVDVLRLEILGALKGGGGGSLGGVGGRCRVALTCLRELRPVQ